MHRLQSVLTSRFMLNLRIDDDSDWLVTTRGAGGSGQPSILTFGRMGAPLDLDGDNDRLEWLYDTEDILGERTIEIEMREGGAESARSSGERNEAQGFLERASEVHESTR